MADDKKKAERHFNWQALKEAVERMKPELHAASEATHKHGADDTPDDSDLDRSVALGYLVESLEGLCGPHLWVLNEISSALYEMHAADGEHGEETPRHHTLSSGNEALPTTVDHRAARRRIQSRGRERTGSGLCLRPR